MKSVIEFPNDYVVIDIETTGRNTRQDEITELAAIRYRNGQEVARYAQLVKTQRPVHGFVIMLTGITNKALKDKPTIDKVIGDFADFIGDDVLIGHNIAAFDSVFIADAYEKHLGRTLGNPCIDTMRIGKKLCPGLPSYSLEALSSHLCVEYRSAHRGSTDCDITNACYQKMRDMVFESGTVESFKEKFKKKKAEDQIGEMLANAGDASSEHPLFGKNIVFTGALLLTRAEAMQMAVDFGAIPQKGVTTKTDFLVVGTQDLDRVGTDGMSSKEEKAIRFNESGKANIKIITEDDFIKMATK